VLIAAPPSQFVGSRILYPLALGAALEGGFCAIVFRTIRYTASRRTFERFKPRATLAVGSQDCLQVPAGFNALSLARFPHPFSIKQV
jgi:hypothetical protein